MEEFYRLKIPSFSTSFLILGPFKGFCRDTGTFIPFCYYSKQDTVRISCGVSGLSYWQYFRKRRGNM
ncbi:hypothetical protein GBV73_10490, partial [Thermococcus sp. 101 C5]|nr:hypothetical protein [Thermococcus sp. 101 C5]